ncbi:MAG: PASTA domain-containing protein [Candidatus Edwardsbacteria bacterium]
MKLKETFKWIGILFAIFVFGFLFANFLLMPLLTQQGKEIEVPDICGKELKEAERVLKEKKLSLMIESSRYDPSIPEGYIISQSPTSPWRVKEGRKILVTVSKGPERVAVPWLTKLSLRQASNLLERAGLQIGKTETANSDSIPKDYVIASIPVTGTIIEKGKMIDLLISLGPELPASVMPDLIGKKLEETQALLISQGLIIGEIKYVKSSGVENGTILMQAPQPGFTIKKGDTVQLAVSVKE